MGGDVTQPSWVKNLKAWRSLPWQLAARLNVPVDLVRRAYKGDEQAFDILLSGKASRTGKKIAHPDLTGPMVEIRKESRPPWMTKKIHDRLFSVLENGNPNIGILVNRDENGDRIGYSVFEDKPGVARVV
jgi:hypothetical protein